MTNDHTWHRAFLALLASRMKPNCFLELGLGPDPAIDSVAVHCKHAYGVDIAPCHPRANATILRMSTDEFFAGIKIEPPDLVFIDADHRSEIVMRDFANVERIAADNCIVILHDTYPESDLFTSDGFCSDSYRVPDMLDCEHVTLPFPPGLTICRVKPRSQV